MQDRAEDERPRRSNLPPLAPRDPGPASSRERSSGSSSVERPPRLTHRSRAGCWTCRGRKVKCDEVHPRCGPCTRLNRDCDWEQRWSFSDATSSTQGKYSNVTTTGNVVWDPSARSSPSSSPTRGGHDDLPNFATLLTDDERERKAESQQPGTYGVVVTPDSFSDHPEYASATPRQGSRRTSTQSSRGGRASPRPGLSRSSTRVDPNVVVVERFEESPTSTSLGPFSPSLPDVSGISLSTPPPGALPSSSHAVHGPPIEEDMLAHFREYIVPRLVQPQQDSMRGLVTQGSTKNAIEDAASHFPPLYHAICAISKLNLSYSGRSSLEEAMQHYHQALAAQSTDGAPPDLLSDGVFFRHYLLFIYDICISMAGDDGDPDMGAAHLRQLERIAIHRHQNRGMGPCAYTLWSICELDVYACLFGSGKCEFLRMVLQQDMLPRLHQQVPFPAAGDVPPNMSYLPYEVQAFPPVLNLKNRIVLHAASLAQAAQTFREEAAMHRSIPPPTMAGWQATVSQLSNELSTIWSQAYPEHLALESPRARELLPERVLSVFQDAFLLFHASTIYLRTSMFPGQRRLPLASAPEVVADTERRVAAVLSCVATQLAAGGTERRAAVFPVFLAGVSTLRADTKQHALHLLAQLDGTGIGQNTAHTRRLLVAVCEAQRRRAAEPGGRMEDVDWLLLAREKALVVVNCGL